MSRSQLVFAAADTLSGAVPSRVVDATMLCAPVDDRFGPAPLPLLAAAAGSR